ncbi:MAG: LytTR family DNA-binding domain-containing protein [Candidatus Delongbacteria bacterium]|jgi:DNA-binding LytR/AlgR family response regulator|nr:LytTR family DNA-binding domain-containing protein [Candidatus Delongbacteria bacterium]
MIKCIAVDDEPLALKQLASYIERTPFLELVNECSNAFEAMDVIAKQHIDLIFIDINMPEMSGMELARTLPDTKNIVFTTAYSEYAVESYKVNAIDYLLKPISYEDFLKSANKANDVISINSKGPDNNMNDHIYVKSEGNLVKIIFKDILYIESMSEYVVFHLNKKDNIMSLMSLKSLDITLPDKFIRVHRSFIVNMEHIQRIERGRIFLDNNKPIKVGDQYKDKFKSILDNFTM